MRYYADEDVPLLVAVIGRALGLDILHTQEYGEAYARKGSRDEAQLRFAAAQGRVLFTVNCRDFDQFTALMFAEGSAHGGVLCIPPPLARRPPAEIARALLRYEQEHPEGMPPYMHDYVSRAHG